MGKRKGKAPIPLAIRFWSKVSIKGPDECWLWTGANNKRGYGSIGVGSRYDPTSKGSEKAHRVAYELTKGPIPEGKCVCHTCDRPGCVNPSHLFVGTQAENIKDMEAKGRRACGDKVGGKGERNGMSKLTAEDILKIRALDGTMTHQKIADMFGVYQGHISSIIRREKWSHIP